MPRPVSETARLQSLTHVDGNKLTHIVDAPSTAVREASAVRAAR